MYIITHPANSAKYFFEILSTKAYPRRAGTAVPAAYEKGLHTRRIQPHAIKNINFYVFVAQLPVAAAVR